MPELPEVETVRQTLKNFILGKKIVNISIYYDKIITGDSKAFIDTIKGQTIRDIDRKGKYLIFILDTVAMISHLRMEGKYNIVGKGTLVNKHEHIGFRFDDGAELRYQDTRKFGRLQLTDKDNYVKLLPLSKLGPEPWAARVEDIYAKLHKRSLPIKTLLLDQSIMAGIGNIYANEICFQAKINPKTAGNAISKKRVAEIIEISKEILEEAIKRGGTTIHSFDSNGVTGLFQLELNVHMQTKCNHCQGEIIKEAVNGRGTYYCQSCQKKRR